MRRHGLLGVMGMLVVAAFYPVSAQKGGKPKPPQEQSATASFLCVGLNTGCGAPDAITGDGGVYTGINDNEPTSARLTGYGEIVVAVNPGFNRWIHLDFTNQVAPPSGSQWRKTFDTYTSDDLVLDTYTIDPGTGERATDGVRSIPEGAAWAARLRGNFAGPNGGLWTFRFSPDAHSGSDYVIVRRLTATSWDIEASPTSAARAWLVSPDLPGGKREPTDEGIYRMPFKLTVTVP